MSSLNYISILCEQVIDGSKLELFSSLDFQSIDDLIYGQILSVANGL